MPPLGVTGSSVDPVVKGRGRNVRGSLLVPGARVRPSRGRVTTRKVVALGCVAWMAMAVAMKSARLIPFVALLLRGLLVGRQNGHPRVLLFVRAASRSRPLFTATKTFGLRCVSRFFSSVFRVSYWRQREKISGAFFPCDTDQLQPLQLPNFGQRWRLLMLRDVTFSVRVAGRLEVKAKLSTGFVLLL